MTRKNWHIVPAENGITLTRRLPARFDVQAQTTLPDGSLKRLAHQIRQDLWRALQNLRGFSPVVELIRVDGLVQVRAGGRIDGAQLVGAPVQGIIQDVLDAPDNRTRWVSNANRGLS